MEKELDRWYHKIWVTRGSRFNASRRLERQHNWSNWTMIILSVYIIALNLLVFIPTYDQMSSIVITIINIVLSVILLGISIYINSKDLKGQYLSHHDCGKKLSVVYNKIASMKDNDRYGQEITDIIEEYQDILERNPLNHEPIDNKYFRLENEEFSNKKIVKNIIWYQYRIATILPYVLINLLPLIIFYLITR